MDIDCTVESQKLKETSKVKAPLRHFRSLPPRSHIDPQIDAVIFSEWDKVQLGSKFEEIWRKPEPDKSESRPAADSIAGVRGIRAPLSIHAQHS